jgi:hypothetical protein
VLSAAQSLSEEGNRLKREVAKFMDTVRAASGFLFCVLGRQIGAQSKP